MMTPDKDFAQLVSESVFMFKHPEAGIESILWELLISKENSVLRDLNRLSMFLSDGDTADNVPGAPGIGPKTAMKLISEFGTIEEVFKNTDKLKGKVKEIIENNKS